MQTRAFGTFLVVAAGLMAVSAPVFAQSADDPFRGETSVNVVEVPVQVVDPETGLPVRGLTVDDFVVRESGAVVDISNFAEILRSSAGPQAEIADAGDAEIAGRESRLVDVIYFFDLYLALKADKVRAVNALREQYRSQVPEDEEVSIVVFDGSLEVLVDRTDDNFDVLDALDEVEATQARGIQQYISFTDGLSEGAAPSGERDAEFYERRQRSNEYFMELEKRVQRVGSALSAAMARYAVADARRVLVAFTPGYPGANWSPSYAPVDFLNASARYPAQELWRDVALEAADLGFTLHVVDSSGLRTSTATNAEIGISEAEMQNMARSGGRGQLSEQAFASPSGGAADPAAADAYSQPSNLGGWMERTRKNLLISSAETTGGKAIFDEDVRKALGEVGGTLDHYYSIGYTTEHVGDGETYEITVELPEHPGVSVSHRTAYQDQPASTRQAQRLRSAMLFGGDANPLGVRVEIGDTDERFRLGAVGSKRVQIPFQLKIPFARIEMIPKNGTHWGRVLISFFGEDQEGNQSELSSQEQSISVASDRYEEAVAKGYFSYKATLEIEGGQQKVYVGIHDVLSGRTSILPQSFEN